jgi:phage shock protein PspC (stress-responsive transcriptional regulator)
MERYRPDDALLAGVCAEMARRLGWNVWAIRAVFVFGMFLKPLWVGAIYIVLAIVMGLLLGGSDSKSEPPGGLGSPDLSDRAQRIADLERKFSDLEKNS